MAPVRPQDELPGLGTTTDLAEFLFGSERNDLSPIRPILTDLQAGRCFYCHKDMKIGDVDHFIPWSRYPVDLGHNFVLAHGKCNSAKGAMLAAEEHLARWVERNRDHGAEIARECDRARVAHDLNASMQVARWAYGQAASAGALAWLRGAIHQGVSADFAGTLFGTPTSDA